MCFVMFKLLYLVESIDYLFQSPTDRCETILRTIHHITSNYPPAVHKIVMNNQGDHYEDIFSYNLIKFLCFKAFIVVFQRRHFKYKEVLAQIKQKIKLFSIPKFKENIDNKGFSKLPKHFENISMRRIMMLDG